MSRDQKYSVGTDWHRDVTNIGAIWNSFTTTSFSDHYIVHRRKMVYETNVIVFFRYNEVKDRIVTVTVL